MWTVGAVVKKFQNLFRNIRLSLWVMGVFVLSNGISGVSDVVLVAVHERTQELELRKF